MQWSRSIRRQEITFPVEIIHMKRIIPFIAVLLLGSFPVAMHAQTTTIILLRHAEKDTTMAGSAAMQADPPLSKAGELRAASLPEVLRNYSPDIIYATAFKRTMATVTPLAKRFGKEVQSYDPRNLQAFEQLLRSMAGKVVIVAGHSNTTPALVNLLIKENRYPAIDDSVYTKLWIVTITNGKAEAKEITY